jgi:hypothetical protein
MALAAIDRADQRDTQAVCNMPFRLGAKPWVFGGSGRLRNRLLAHSQKRISSGRACCFRIARIAKVEDQRTGGTGIRSERQVPQLIRRRHAPDLECPDLRSQPLLFLQSGYCGVLSMTETCFRTRLVWLSAGAASAQQHSWSSGDKNPERCARTTEHRSEKQRSAAQQPQFNGFLLTLDCQNKPETVAMSS